MSFTFTNYAALPIPEDSYTTALNRALKLMGQGQELMQGQAKAKYAMPMAQQQLQQAIYNNQILAPKAQYAPQMTQEEFRKIQQYNDMYKPDIQSKINLRGSQGRHLGAETSKLNYQLNHPGYMGDSTTQLIQYLKDQGNNQQNNTMEQPSENLSNSQKNNPIEQISQNTENNNPNTGNNNTNNKPIEQNYNVEKSNIESPIYTTDDIKDDKSLLDQDNVSPFQVNTGNKKNDQMINSLLNQKYARASYDQRMSKAFNWVHATPDQKRYQMAQLNGAGIDVSESLQMLSKGMTVPQILKSRGFDPNNPPEPDFLPTGGNVTQLKKRQAALKEMNSLGTFIREGLGPYSRTVMGMSIPQVGQALIGMNKDKQAHFLAARMLAPELSNVRLITAQARGGITAVKQMMDKSLMNVGAFQSLVSPEVFSKAQILAEQALTDSMMKSNEVYTVGKGKGNKNTLSDPLGIR